LVLAISGHLVVKSLVKVARYYRWREFVIGFILIALATSIPELFVGISSALTQIPSLSLGNIIGSNIINLTLIIGVAALLGKKIKIEKEIEKKDLYYTSVIAILTRIGHFKKVSNGVAKKEVPIKLITFIISLIILLISANFVVEYSSLLIIDLALPPILIGLIIVSVGTTLPELSFEVYSILKGFSGMALGNLLGSVVVNSTLVLGITSIILPIQAYFPSFIIGTLFLLINLILFIIFAKTKKEISWKEGIILIILYVIFTISSLLTRGY
jgi:cation:H+ antiporter